jgi:hypothetical protein
VTTAVLYRPSWVVNMTIRFDEALLVQTTPVADEFGAEPTTDPRVVPGTVLASGRVVPGLAPAPRSDLKPLVLQPSRESLLANIRPMSCTVESPTPRQAGKFKMAIAYRDFPIDPRLCRAIGVEIYLGSIPDDDFARGITGPGSGKTRSSQISSQQSGQANSEKLLMVGFVDSQNADHDEKSSRINMEGRDLRGYFLDGKPAPALLAKLDLRKPIATGARPIGATFGHIASVRGDGVVEQILALCPFGQLITVVVDQGEWPNNVIPSPGTADGATRVTLGASGGQARGQPGQPGQQQQGGQQAGTTSSRPSAWDLITQYCFLVGAVPYFEGWTLHVRPSRGLLELRAAGLDAEAVKRRAQARAEGRNLPDLPTPFRGGVPRDVQESKPLRLRRMVYGRDLKSLSFERKFGGAKTPTVEVVGIDDRVRGKQKLLLAQWPPKAEVQARTTKVAPGGQVAQHDTIRIPVHGIRDVKRLEEVAHGLYEEIGRQEMGGKAETNELTSFYVRDEDADDVDLCRLRTGDAVEFLVDTRALSSRSPLVAPLVDQERVSFDAAVDQILKVLETDDVNLARAIVASGRSSVVQDLRTFKVACARYELKAGGATTIAFDFQNYVVVRQQVAPEIKRGHGKDVLLGRTPSRRPQAKPPAPKQPAAIEPVVSVRVPNFADQATSALAERLVNLGAVGLRK